MSLKIPTAKAASFGANHWSTFLPEQDLKPDFEFRSAPGHALAYAHRVAGEADIYFVSNQRRQFDSAECTFRVSGKVPELWHPDTGMIEAAPVWSAKAGRTTVRLDFEPAGSVFVIFRHTADGADHVVAVSGNGCRRISATPKLEIQRADLHRHRRRGRDGRHGKTFRDRCATASLALRQTTMFFGGDPAVNHVKELRVDYTLDGKPGQVTVPENETLTLPATSVRPPAAVGNERRRRRLAGREGVGQWPRRIAHGQRKGSARRSGGRARAAEVTGAWDVSFPPNWGAPPSVTLDKLISWTDHTQRRRALFFRHGHL